MGVSGPNIVNVGEPGIHASTVVDVAQGRISSRPVGVSLPTISLVQTASVADGSAGVVVPFGSAVVAGAGTAAANGTYTYRGQFNGKPYFNKVGSPNNPLSNAVSWDSGGWFSIWDVDGNPLYDSQSAPLLPWDVSAWVADYADNPTPPTVTASRVLAAGESVVLVAGCDAAPDDWTTQPTAIGGGMDINQLAGGFGLAANSLLFEAEATGGETGVQMALNAAGPLNAFVTIPNRAVTVGAAASISNVDTTSLSLEELTGSGLTIAAYAIAEGSDKFGAVPAGCTDLGTFGQPALGMRVVSGTPGTITQTWSPSAVGSAVGVVLT